MVIEPKVVTLPLQVVTAVDVNTGLAGTGAMQSGGNVTDTFLSDVLNVKV